MAFADMWPVLDNTRSFLSTVDIPYLNEETLLLSRLLGGLNWQ
jgi:hypothetical protein